MIDTPAPHEPVKQRCPIDGHTAFLFVCDGLSYRCRICKQVHVVVWEDILQRYTALRKEEK